MARGDMKIDTLAVNAEEEILNRKEFQAVANTVDFADVSDIAANGLKVVKAGTPVAPLNGEMKLTIGMADNTLYSYSYVNVQIIWI